METIDKVYKTRNNFISTINAKLADIKGNDKVLESHNEAIFSSRPASELLYANLAGHPIESFVVKEGMDASMIVQTSMDMSANNIIVNTLLPVYKGFINDKNNNKTTEVHAALDDAKNLILAQNTVYTIGTLAVATLLISAILYTSKE